MSRQIPYRETLTNGRFHGDDFTYGGMDLIIALGATLRLMCCCDAVCAGLISFFMVLHASITLFYWAESNSVRTVLIASR